MILTIKAYVCADCRAMKEFKNTPAARSAGWAVARDGQTCYCPKCAPKRRHVGRTPRAAGNQSAGQITLFDGLKQTVN